MDSFCLATVARESAAEPLCCCAYMHSWHAPRHGVEGVEGAAGREVAEVDVGHAELLEGEVQVDGDGAGPLRDDAERRLSRVAVGGGKTAVRPSVSQSVGRIDRVLGPVSRSTIHSDRPPALLTAHLPVVQRQQLRRRVAARVQAAEAGDGVDVHHGRRGQARQGRRPQHALHHAQGPPGEVGAEAAAEGGPVGPVGDGWMGEIRWCGDGPPFLSCGLCFWLMVRTGRWRPWSAPPPRPSGGPAACANPKQRMCASTCEPGNLLEADRAITPPPGRSTPNQLTHRRPPLVPNTPLLPPLPSSRGSSRRRPAPCWSSEMLKCCAITSASCCGKA